MNKEKIAKWFLENFQTHTDWTGTRVETVDNFSSVKEVIDMFFRDLEETI